MGKITLAHGSGGRMTHDLIKDLFFKALGNEFLEKSDDSAILPKEDDKRIAFTTDSFVVKPLFFPGGDIGKLAICGTVNDLAVNGAVPKYLSCGFIIEEGLDEECLERIVSSMAIWAKKSNVKIVCGDTKVVEKNAADGIFINTSGIGFMKPAVNLSIDNIAPNDKVIVTGTLGDHGIAVLGKRKGLEFDSQAVSDCAPLNHMLNSLIDNVKGIKFMRDATRGGLVTTLNEIAESNKYGILIKEKDIPVSESVKAACELLGLDPLYIANEGKAIIIVDSTSSDKALEILRSSEYGKDSKIIGEVTKDNSGKVCLETTLGVVRVLDMLQAEPIPRIC